MITNPSDARRLPPTGELQSDLQATTPNWFDYPVIAHPHHTDYGGNVWHGAYISWMEEARIECLRSIGVEFADLVALGCDLPVVELALRYHQPVRMGMAAIVKTRMVEMSGVRINWDYQIESTDGQTLFVSASVTLVAVDREKGKILRQLPPIVKSALVRLSES
ncbi:acyl-CoA thioesterase [Phormidium sp. CLA17]|uniref:acyl-CoA thioesterase n=1 Tax=Leptolyngbya sp. Cla-17 TaxID=2803751 RepID=UPI001491B2E9|nr:thioesterase family protein [Leptolyngbya sp. Cla-17]MBM0741218.1 acyl-CoA thioesterase [Leptolyngbya sp. Cla-17]